MLDALLDVLLDVLQGKIPTSKVLSNFESGLRLRSGWRCSRCAAGMVWNWGDSLIADFIAACIAYRGGELSIGALVGFVERPSRDDVSKHYIPGRSGISGMR
jgi:hypothetical protein